MYVWMHKTLFLIFLDDNAYINACNSIFFNSLSYSMLMYLQVFQWFYKLFFLSINFSKTMFQKDMYKFSKTECMNKIFFQWFSNVSKFMYEGIFFNDFFIVYSKIMYKDFSKYIFLCTLKGFFMCKEYV